MSLRRALIAVALALTLAGTASAQEQVTPSQMRAIAVSAYEAGQFAQAEQLARALLDRDPADRAGLLILAQVALQAGRPADARRLAARLFRAETDSRGRYAAARLTAFAAAQDERYGLAGFWLRRALTQTTDPAQIEQTVADARLMRDRNPWTTRLSFGLSPSDNVNGGSRSAFNVIEGFPFVGQLSPDARALSGWSGSLDLSARYRLSTGPRHQIEATARLSGRAVWLSDAARDFIAAESDPRDRAITNADFGSGRIEVGLSHLFALQSGTGQLEFDLGRYFSGQDDAYGYARLTATRAFALSDTAGLRLQAFGEWRRESGAVTDIRRGVEARWQGTLSDRQQFGLTLGWAETLSDNRNAIAEGWTVQADWDLGRRLGPVTIGAAIGAQWTDYGEYRVLFPVPGGRQDERLFGQLTLGVPDVSYAGFTPVITLGYDRTESNVSRFEVDGFSVDFGLRSTF